MQRYLKALIASAFLFSTFLFSAPAALAAPCQLPAGYQSARLEKVFDGDTLLLTDGRRVRLIGINTPERARDSRPAEPLADTARERLQQWLQEGSVLLVPGTERKDRYGRLLAHVFTPAGESLEERLLREGLGLQISIPPNLALRECLRAAEAEARAQRRGVWSLPYFAPREVRQLQPGDGGFGRYQGRVSRVGENRGGAYLELSERVYLPISKAGREHLPLADLQALEGQRIEVRGWLSHRELSPSQRARHWRPFRLYLSHPDQITRLAP